MTRPSPLPLLVVLDLDMCCWEPEMFQLNGAPSKWSSSDNSIKAGSDTIRMFPGAALAMRNIHLDKDFANTKLAVASSTTEPEWARKCMSLFEISQGVKMAQVVSHAQIFCADKTNHFNNLHRETGIAFGDMLFFDDCNWGDNCADVERGCPGVVTVKTPHGMTEDKWKEGLEKFASAKSQRSN